MHGRHRIPLFRYGRARDGTASDVAVRRPADVSCQAKTAEALGRNFRQQVDGAGRFYRDPSDDGRFRRRPLSYGSTHSWQHDGQPGVSRSKERTANRDLRNEIFGRVESGTSGRTLARAPRYAELDFGQRIRRCSNLAHAVTPIFPAAIARATTTRSSRYFGASTVPSANQPLPIIPSSLTDCGR